MLARDLLTTDLSVRKEYWDYPVDLIKQLAKEESADDLNLLARGILLLVSKNSKNLPKFMRTVFNHATDAASFPAFHLLRSIKKNRIHPDWEMTFEDLSSYLDVLGIYGLEGLNEQELFELDREICIRGHKKSKTIVILDYDVSKPNLPMTERAYEGRVVRME